MVNSRPRFFRPLSRPAVFDSMPLLQLTESSAASTPATPQAVGPPAARISPQAGAAARTPTPPSAHARLPAPARPLAHGRPPTLAQTSVRLRSSEYVASAGHSRGALSEPRVRPPRPLVALQRPAMPDAGLGIQAETDARLGIRAEPNASLGLRAEPNAILRLQTEPDTRLQLVPVMPGAYPQDPLPVVVVPPRYLWWQQVQAGVQHAWGYLAPKAAFAAAVTSGFAFYMHAATGNPLALCAALTMMATGTACVVGFRESVRPAESLLYQLGAKVGWAGDLCVRKADWAWKQLAFLGGKTVEGFTFVREKLNTWCQSSLRPKWVRHVLIGLIFFLLLMVVGNASVAMAASRAARPRP